MPKTFILDTNIILDDPANIIKLSENGKNKIVIPETVIDELDSKKSGFDTINFNAREFGRLMETAKIEKTQRKKNITIVQTSPEDIEIDIYIVSKETYKCEKGGISHNILNDRKILEIATDYCAIVNASSIFLSLDIMCRTRALSLGINVDTLQGDSDVADYTFHKTIELEELNEKEIHGKNILLVDPDYIPCNFSYTLTFPNTNQQLFGQVQNGHLFLLDTASLEDKKQSVKPINVEQKFFVNAMTEGYADILAIDAKAGSGKTLLSLSTAMRLVKDKNTVYTRIIYVRNSIESLDKGEDVGYLPGMEEKFAIYNHPLMDNLQYIVREDIRRSKANKSKAAQAKESKEDEQVIQERVQTYIEQFGIETMWVGEMRGRTLNDAIVIIDEAQNMSSKTLQLVLSRLDLTCKAIVIGSNKQIDNMYTNKYINGLSVLMKATKDSHDEVRLFAGELNKVLRGPITEFTEKVFN